MSQGHHASNVPTMLSDRSDFSRQACLKDLYGLHDL